MPIRPSVLKSLTKPLTFTYLGEEVNIAYYPSAMGDEMLKTAQSLMTELNAAQTTQDDATLADAMQKTGAWICSFLASWDYVQDDGVTPQPITPENLAAQLATFPDFIQAIIQAIMADRSQGNATGTPASAN